MLLSIAIILLGGVLFGELCRRLGIPALVGMIVVGMLVSPYAFDLLDEKMLLIAADVRQIALVIILTKAGLTLRIKDLKQVGRPAILMCFVPACFEMVGTAIFAPLLFGISLPEALLLGSVLAAVSPAVIVPRMTKMIEEGKGQKHRIPQLILAGASLDDIFVIVLFSSFLSFVKTSHMNVQMFLRIPISLVMGAFCGILVGWLLVWLFRKVHLRDSSKVLVILGGSFVLITIQDALTGSFTISALVAIMVMGMVIKAKYEPLAIRLGVKYNKLWVGAEIMLFVLVGVTIDMRYVGEMAGSAVLLVLLALCVRMLGVSCCLLGSSLTKKERLFCMGAYLPKATVQAAIGALPLAVGLPCGKIVVTVAVVSILISAPIGSFFIDHTWERLVES